MDLAELRTRPVGEQLAVIVAGIPRPERLIEVIVFESVVRRAVFEQPPAEVQMLPREGIRVRGQRDPPPNRWFVDSVPLPHLLKSMDTLTTVERSLRMAAVRGSGNKSTELRLIAAFRAFGLKGWRRGSRIVGKPDFVFPKLRIAVFVDGCFWHGCPRHCRIPASRSEYWHTKIAGNVRRDRVVSRALRKIGWHVLRVWEHELSAHARLGLAGKFVRLGLVTSQRVRSSEKDRSRGRQPTHCSV